MPSLAPKRAAPALFLVHSAPSWRPLFVPPGIAKVRTGRTTPAELARLAADEPAPAATSAEPSVLARVLGLCGLVSTHAR